MINIFRHQKCFSFTQNFFSGNFCFPQILGNKSLLSKLLFFAQSVFEGQILTTGAFTIKKIIIIIQKWSNSVLINTDWKESFVRRKTFFLRLNLNTRLFLKINSADKTFPPESFRSFFPRYVKQWKPSVCFRNTHFDHQRLKCIIKLF